MEVKEYLIDYGHNTVRGGSCYKESIMNCNDLVKFSEIIKTIINNQNNNNWANGIYLEFENMQDLRNQVLAKISDELKSNTLQQNFTGEPLIDLDLSYLYFAKEHVDLFRAMFVDCKFGNQMIVDTLMGLGLEKFKQQFDAEQFSEERLNHIVISNWIAATGLATLLINKMANFTQAQMISVLKAQIHEAMLNDRLTNVEENPLFAADSDASLEERLG